jgi:enoyl-CoA hydratase/carnithine racemase
VNRFNRSFLNELNDALDTVEASAGPAALVTTGGTEKFYSNGLDLAWIAGDGQSEGGAFVGDVMRFLGRLMAFPVPTVAAINGHAFAAGAMMALAHDFRVMRADRGFLCLNEIDIHIPLAPGMSALVKNRLPATTLRDMVLTGMRIGGAGPRPGIVGNRCSISHYTPPPGRAPTRSRNTRSSRPPEGLAVLRLGGGWLPPLILRRGHRGRLPG